MINLWRPVNGNELEEGAGRVSPGEYRIELLAGVFVSVLGGW